MNCPRHIREVTKPEAIEEVKEHDEMEDLAAIIAGPEDHHIVP